MRILRPHETATPRAILLLLLLGACGEAPSSGSGDLVDSLYDDTVANATTDEGSNADSDDVALPDTSDAPGDTESGQDGTEDTAVEDTTADTAVEDTTPPPFPVCPIFAAGVNAGFVSNLSIREASGVAASRRYGNVLWTHNDYGDSNRIFAIATNGTSFAT